MKKSAIADSFLFDFTMRRPTTDGGRLPPAAFPFQ
jgi:hypothetical protein